MRKTPEALVFSKHTHSVQGDAVSLLDYYIQQRSIRAMNTGGGSYSAVTVDNEGIHKSYIPNVGGGIDSISEATYALTSSLLDALGFCQGIILLHPKVAPQTS